MKKKLGGFVGLALVLQLASLPAHALTVERSDDVAVLTGSMDYPDSRRIKAAYEEGARTFVLRRVGGGDMDAIHAVADTIGDLKVRVVLDGVCGGGCPQLLAAGQERRFMSRKDGFNAVLITGAMYYGDASGPSNMPGSYAVARGILAEEIPSALIRKHTNGSTPEGALVIIPDGRAAGVLDCDSLRTFPKSCKPVPDLSASSSGLFTSLEPWTLPENPRAQEQGSPGADSARPRP